ncbi:MAG: hypothetical protein IPP51_11520 [Bacteroidetes bacterium]|nr:hypothetical protein [Bacteroidota bacterium]
MSSLRVSAQAPVKVANGYRVPYIIEKDDTIPVINLPEVKIEETSPDYIKNLQEYYRLRFNVIKVYPTRDWQPLSLMK